MADSEISESTINVVEFPASEEERLYFEERFNHFDDVPDLRSHCTSCDNHIGCAISAPMKTHPVLQVSMCLECYKFYTSGEFDKGEDGSELYCRWCGEGGQVICCSTCCFVFCSRCIKHNASKDYLDKVKEIDNWICFACDPKLIMQQRAEHLALTKFIGERRTELHTSTLNTAERSRQIRDDQSKCCKPKSLKRKEVQTVEVVASEHIILPKKQKKEEQVIKASETVGTQAKTPSVNLVPNQEIPTITPFSLFASINDSIDMNSTILNTSTPEVIESEPISPPNNEVTCTPDLNYLFQPTGNTDASNEEKRVPPITNQMPIKRNPPRHNVPQNQPKPVEVKPMKSVKIPLTKKYKERVMLKGMDALNKQIAVGSDVAQHMHNKLITFLKTNAHQSASTLTDLKDLHIHLSYLYSYSIRRLEDAITICSSTMKDINKSLITKSSVPKKVDTREYDSISEMSNNSYKEINDFCQVEILTESNSQNNANAMSTNHENVVNSNPDHSMNRNYENLLDVDEQNSSIDNLLEENTNIVTIIEDQQFESISDSMLLRANDTETVEDQ